MEINDNDLLERNIELLFPTPIHYAVFGGKTYMNVQDELYEAYNKVEWVHPENWGSTHDLSTTDFQQNDIEKYGLENFKRLLHQELSLYCAYMEFPMRDYKVTSWFSRFKPNDFGILHHHGFADISGCYYLKTNNKDGKIFFESPADSATTSLCYEKYTKRWDHVPVQGKMLLFPGWMKHGIQRNLTDTTRVSFAFNIFFNRDTK